MSNSIEQIMLKGLSSQFKKAFKLPSDPIYTPVSDYRHTLSELQQQKGEAIRYPIFCFAMNQVALSDNLPVIPAQIQGVYTSTSRDGRSVANIPLIPTTFSFELTALHNSHTTALDFVSQWLRSSLDGSLSFTVNFDGVKVALQVLPDRSVSMPKKEMTVEEAAHYEVTASFTVNGYLSGEYEDNVVSVPMVENSRSDTKVSTASHSGVIRNVRQRYEALTEGKDNSQINLAFTLKRK